MLTVCTMQTNNLTKMPDYGEAEFVEIDRVEDFWVLWDELNDDDECGLKHSRNILLEAFKDGNLWGLRIAETDGMFARGAHTDPVFCKTSKGAQMYLLPCLICDRNTKTYTKIDIIWVHPRARRMGYAMKMVSILYEVAPLPLIPDRPVPESIPFWETCKEAGLLAEDCEL